MYLDLAFAYVIVLLFFGAAGALIVGAALPAGGMFLTSLGLLYLTQR